MPLRASPVNAFHNVLRTKVPAHLARIIGGPSGELVESIGCAEKSEANINLLHDGRLFGDIAAASSWRRSCWR